ncbi:MAG: hypothetical protein Q4F43_02300 [Eubacteriales bacterium]|nr:hypothetical protein [Eubacteriales bacterium]
MPNKKRSNRIRSFFKSESEKLSRLTTRQKLAYIRDYYWLQISLVVIVLTLSSFVIYRVRTTLSDHWFYLMLANTRMEAGTNSPLWEGYVDYSGYDLSEKRIEFNDEAWFDYGKNKAAGNKYYEIFVGFTDVGILDAVAMEPDNLTSLGESGRLLDLNADKCSRIRKKYGDRFLYSIPYNKEYSTDPVPVGIDISDSILISKYHLYTNGCAIGIGAQSEHLEAVELFLDYILQ